MENPTNQTKPTSIKSWLGFSISVVVFLLIWLVNLLLFSGRGLEAIGSLCILILMATAVLGIFALVFSIDGLSSAIKSGAPKWIGTTGIIICVLSVLSFLAPLIYAGINGTGTHSSDSEIVCGTGPMIPEEQTAEVSEDITIRVLRYGEVQCTNNTDRANSVIGNLHTYEHDFDRQLAMWLRMNEVNSSKRVVIRAANDADYSDITNVIEVLNANGISNFRLSN